MIVDLRISKNFPKCDYEVPSDVGEIVERETEKRERERVKRSRYVTLWFVYGLHEHEPMIKKRMN